jgi:parallel beta-helix repeat protein
MVFVYNNSSPYYEHILVDKSITLLGEDKETTVIDGNRSGDVITILSDQVLLKSFTIAHSGRDYDDYNAGIKILSDENMIIETNITFNLNGIVLSSSHHNHINYNSINYNSVGVRIIENSHYNTISNNILESWSFDYIIYLNACENNLFANNTIINYDGWGIYSYLSDRNTYCDNIIQKSENGISLVFSNHSIITGNIFQDNDDGLSLTGSTDTIISQNIFINDGLFVYNSFDNLVSDNTVNGKPLLYLEGESDKVISESAGQIILINCSSIIVEHQEIRNTNIGIELVNTDNCKISQNSLIHNTMNVYLFSSDFNIIEDNALKTNTSYFFRHSLEVNNCTGTTVKNNDITITDSYTYILISKSSETLFAGNTITCLSPSRWRLILTYSQGNRITDNTFSSGGIRLFSCNNNNVVENTIHDSSFDIDSSDGNIISNNIVADCLEDYGIKLDSSHRNIILKNTITNSKGAFLLTSSRFNRISSNSMINCGSELAWHSNSLLNRWNRNYWNESSARPKIILGEIRIIRGWPYPDIVFPVFNIDLFPRFFPHLQEN